MSRVQVEVDPVLVDKPRSNKVSFTAMALQAAPASRLAASVPSPAQWMIEPSDPNIKNAASLAGIFCKTRTDFSHVKYSIYPLIDDLLADLRGHSSGQEDIDSILSAGLNFLQENTSGPVSGLFISSHEDLRLQFGVTNEDAFREFNRALAFKAPLDMPILHIHRAGPKIQSAHEKIEQAKWVKDILPEQQGIQTIRFIHDSAPIIMSLVSMIPYFDDLRILELDFI